MSDITKAEFEKAKGIMQGIEALPLGTWIMLENETSNLIPGNQGREFVFSRVVGPYLGINKKGYFVTYNGSKVYTTLDSGMNNPNSYVFQIAIAKEGKEIYLPVFAKPKFLNAFDVSLKHEHPAIGTDNIYDVFEDLTLSNTKRNIFFGGAVKALVKFVSDFHSHYVLHNPPQ